MSYGLRAISSNNVVQIDETYHNYSIYSKFTIGTAGVFSAPNISGVLVFINAPSQKIRLSSLSGLNYSVGGITSSATVVCMTRTDQYNIVNAGSYGLQVFNTNNEKSFDSRYPYANVLSTANYGIRTTQTVTVPTTKTVFVNLDALGRAYRISDSGSHVSTTYNYSATIVGNRVTFSPVSVSTGAFGGADTLTYLYGNYRNVTILGIN